ncbi:redox-sensing transcriptional repressor Rex [Planctomycetota bacterium]
MRYAKIPEQTVRRLPIYLRALSYWAELERTKISSKDLAESVGLNAGQIRKDFSYFGEFGTPGVGYDVDALSLQIKKILKLDATKKVALVGVDNLGTAVLSYTGFDRYGLTIAAAFDAKRVGKKVKGIEIEDVSKLSSLKQRGINMAIVAVPVGVAQQVVEELVKAGVKGIINFAACHLVVPKRVKVTNIDIGMDLASLPYYLPVS